MQSSNYNNCASLGCSLMTAIIIEATREELYLPSPKDIIRQEPSDRAGCLIKVEVKHTSLPASTSIVIAFVAWLEMSRQVSKLFVCLASISRAYKI
ncbi:11860_t:CDS:2 [Dentiscutata erythropus]|uniref:11860_t:CDS:1 n=1 Tax=Dentiscutata erythropus TaxID=1348616 RepID=A0A9N9F0Y3_9GLOM|nr:11860_t:CDS:2 [Dentiscutata erythropus]